MPATGSPLLVTGEACPPMRRRSAEGALRLRRCRRRLHSWQSAATTRSRPFLRPFVRFRCAPPLHLPLEVLTKKWLLLAAAVRWRGPIALPSVWRRTIWLSSGSARRPSNSTSVWGTLPAERPHWTTITLRHGLAPATATVRTRRTSSGAAAAAAGRTLASTAAASSVPQRRSCVAHARAPTARRHE